VIPLQTNLFVPGYGVGVAGDTGGGVRRYHVDLGFDDDNYEGWHWYVDVYLLEPVPSNIPWILP
jgi:3D (Asp-Asp-Asp) domain-containing protein